MNKKILHDQYVVPKVIIGCWQLAGGHGHINSDQAVKNLFKLYQAGFTTFDCADIYTGVEELLGHFLRKFATKFDPDQPVQIHTKFVPDLDILPHITFEYVESIIDRSLRRLGVETLDLLQFHWWNYSVPRYVEVALMLQKLQNKGKIRNLGLTNFDVQRLDEMVAEGVTFFSNQIQYSVLDSRPEYQMLQTLEKHNMKALCYGTVAGGLLSDKFFSKPQPQEPYENRSLTKYLLILNEYVQDWNHFQEILQILGKIAKKYEVDIATVASVYILHQKQVGSVIIGARNLQHVDLMQQVKQIVLDLEDLQLIEATINELKTPKDFRVYGFERNVESAHAKIMKYNLNSKRT